MADPQLVQQTQYQVGFTPEMAPAQQDLLAQAQAFTDPSQNPYMQYQGDRTAQFTPLQNQAFEGAALMQSAPQLQQASAVAGQAGLGALNTGYTYNPYASQSFTNPGVAQQYMNPYLDVQNNAAYRNSQIQNAQNNAMMSGLFSLGGALGGAAIKKG